MLDALRKLHVNTGHPPNEDLRRILRLSGASDLALRAVRYLRCSTCARLARPRLQRPSRVPASGIGFNEVVYVDLYYLLDA